MEAAGDREAAAAAIRQGLQSRLSIGNLDTKRDWGHARDYVEWMWRILQHSTPEDFVLATGETHSVRELIELAFSEVGFVVRWQGSGVEEVGVDATSGNVLIQVDPRYFRPAEVELLLGDPSKARDKLGWRHTTGFDEMIREMVASDLDAVVRDRERRDRNA